MKALIDGLWHRTVCGVSGMALSIAIVLVIFAPAGLAWAGYTYIPGLYWLGVATPIVLRYPAYWLVKLGIWLVNWYGTDDYVSFREDLSELRGTVGKWVRRKAHRLALLPYVGRVSGYNQCRQHPHPTWHESYDSFTAKTTEFVKDRAEDFQINPWQVVTFALLQISSLLAVMVVFGISLDWGEQRAAALGIYIVIIGEMILLMSAMIIWDYLDSRPIPDDNQRFLACIGTSNIPFWCMAGAAWFTQSTPWTFAAFLLGTIPMAGILAFAYKCDDGSSSAQEPASA
ncbi:MAG: hypothetical protein GC129_02765 [Proteobacteria bacterium]|nr:hypothetical protein [Pseudomonadota bacterium]